MILRCTSTCDHMMSPLFFPCCNPVHNLMSLSPWNFKRGKVFHWQRAEFKPAAAPLASYDLCVTHHAPLLQTMFFEHFSICISVLDPKMNWKLKGIHLTVWAILPDTWMCYPTAFLSVLWGLTYNRHKHISLLLLYLAYLCDWDSWRNWTQKLYNFEQFPNLLS